MVCWYVNIPILSLNVAYLIATLLFMTPSTVYVQMRANKLLFIGAVLYVVGHGFHFSLTLGALITGRIFIGGEVGVITLESCMLLLNNN